MLLATVSYQFFYVPVPIFVVIALLQHTFLENFYSCVDFFLFVQQFLNLFLLKTGSRLAIIILTLNFAKSVNIVGTVVITVCVNIVLHGSEKVILTD